MSEYEKREILAMHAKGMSPSAIGASMNIPLGDVLNVLREAGR